MGELVLTFRITDHSPANKIRNCVLIWQEATFGHKHNMPKDKEGLQSYIRKHLIQAFRKKNAENAATGQSGVPLEIRYDE